MTYYLSFYDSKMIDLSPDRLGNIKQQIFFVISYLGSKFFFEMLLNKIYILINPFIHDVEKLPKT